jgi:putative GTP pyrophosphokinase
MIVGRIRNTLELEPTGRPAKSTPSIIEKLQRESIRLSQIQDIAGCRVVVANVIVQDLVVQALSGLFPDARVVDRRLNPSHGYRAVHVVVGADGRDIEVQVRTSLQHLWAEYSEKLSDLRDPALKYGGGDEEIQSMLQETSFLVSEIEDFERQPTWALPATNAERLAGIKTQLSKILQDSVASLVRRES